MPTLDTYAGTGLDWDTVNNKFALPSTTIAAIAAAATQTALAAETTRAESAESTALGAANAAAATANAAATVTALATEVARAEAAEGLAEKAANKGVANGYAGLGATAKMPIATLDDAGATAGQVLGFNGTTNVWTTPAGGGVQIGTASGTARDAALAITAETSALSAAQAAQTTANAAATASALATEVARAEAAEALALKAASNLSDVANAATARTNLGLGGAATLSVGTAAGTVPDAGAVATSLAATEKVANKGVANGYAGLGATAKLPIATLDSAGATSGQVLGFNGTTNVWTTPAGGGGGVSIGTTSGTARDAALAITAETAALTAAQAAATTANAAATATALATEVSRAEAAEATKATTVALAAEATTARAAESAAQTTANAAATQTALTAEISRAEAAEALALKAASNLSDLANVGTARTNLGLGGAAVLAVGTAAGTVAAGNDSRIVAAATQTALAAEATTARAAEASAEKTANKGIANGYAGLGATAKMPIATIDPSGATSGQALTFNGTALAWATPAGGGVSIGTTSGTARDAALAITAEAAALSAAQAAQTTATAAMPKSGGAMVGALVLAADPIVALGAATMQYVQAQASPTPVATASVAGKVKPGLNLTVEGDGTLDVTSVAPTPATSIPALSAMLLLLSDGTTLTGTQLQSLLGTPTIVATAAAAMAGVPPSGIAGTALSGITTVLTPSGATAYACLYSGGADQGARTAFTGTAVPILTPAATGSTTVRIYAAASGGSPLAESSAFTVTATGTVVSTPAGGVVGIPVAFTGTSNLSTVYVSFIWSGVEGVRVSCTVTSGAFSGSVTPLQTYLGANTIVVHDAASGGTLLYTSPTTFVIAAQTATITAPTGTFHQGSALSVGGATDLPAVFVSLTLAGVEQTPRIAATVTSSAWTASLTPASTGTYVISTWFASTGGTALATSSITVAATPVATVTTPSGTITQGAPLTIIGTTNQSAGFVSITEGGVEQTPRTAVTVSSPNWTSSVTPSAAGSSTASFYLASTGGTALATSGAFTVGAQVTNTYLVTDVPGATFSKAYSLGGTNYAGASGVVFVNTAGGVTPASVDFAFGTSATVAPVKGTAGGDYGINANDFGVGTLFGNQASFPGAWNNSASQVYIFANGHTAGTVRTLYMWAIPTDGSGPPAVYAGAGTTPQALTVTY